MAAKVIELERGGKLHYILILTCKGRDYDVSFGVAEAKLILKEMEAIRDFVKQFEAVK